MSESQPTLILFPGLGVDEKLFEPQQSIPAKIIVPSWPEPQKNESLPHYVRRIIDALPSLPENHWLGGVSFGGIVALEAAKLLKPRGVFLIASYVSARELSVPARIMSWIAPNLPSSIIGLLLKLAPLMVRATGRPNRSQRRLLLNLLRDSNIPLTEWAPTHISKYEMSPLPCPVYRIHGMDDRIIPFPKAIVDLAIFGAGHIVNVTNSRQVNDFIAKTMLDYIGSSFTV